MTKRNLKRLLLLLLTLTAVICLAFAFVACSDDNGQSKTTPSEGLEYTLSDNGSYYIVSGIGSCTDNYIVIPSTYNDLIVLSIRDNAFFNCTKLKSITIPDCVETIGDSAFSWCTALKSITIADSVITIGDKAFYGCTKLKSITIGSGVTSIGKCAFSNTAYYNDSSNWTDNVLYIGTYLIEANTSISGNYEIKDGRPTVIANYAFFGRTSLTSVTIPDSVTSIGEAAFNYCTSLTSVTIGSGVTTIGNFAFQDCTSLTSVTIGDSVTTIGISAFRNCTSLEGITIGSGVTSIDSYAFEGCTSLKNVYYKGTASEWTAISKRDFYTSATIYYYAENGSTTVAGKYWYYDNDGNIKTWRCLVI